jgi:hypothetical protein
MLSAAVVDTERIVARALGRNTEEGWKARAVIGSNIDHLIWLLSIRISNLGFSPAHLFEARGGVGLGFLDFSELKGREEKKR